MCAVISCISVFLLLKLYLRTVECYISGLSVSKSFRILYIVGGSWVHDCWCCSGWRGWPLNINVPGWHAPSDQTAAGNIRLPLPHFYTTGLFPHTYFMNSFSTAALSAYKYLLHGAESSCPAVQLYRNMSVVRLNVWNWIHDAIICSNTHKITSNCLLYDATGKECLEVV